MGTPFELTDKAGKTVTSCCKKGGTSLLGKSDMINPTRRQFLAASALTLSAASYTRASIRPNDALRVAIMGARIRGKFHLGAFPKQQNVEVTHLIEPDSNIVPEAIGVLAKGQATKPAVATDVRKVLESKDVDVLVVAAPDHWHALATVWACQAGKHVYCEKPASHNLVEGRRMVQAARKNKCHVQIGTQRRSAPHLAAARDFIASGKLGKVPFARAWIAGSRKSIGKLQPGTVPAGVDYSLWLGPCPETPFHPNRFHYNWHWWWDLGTGELGNNGIHGLDVIRFVLKLDTPTKISSGGGKYYYDDDQETPDTQTATFDFPGCTAVWEHRIWAKKDLEGESFGIAFHGENGTLVVDSKGWHVRDGVEGSEKQSAGIEALHIRNFLDVIRGNAKTLNADVEEGHKSTMLCHLGNAAFRSGKTLHFDANKETVNEKDAMPYLTRAYRKGFELPKVEL
jgi:predicted dehydrogenase